jgi:hypothetical protein
MADAKVKVTKKNVLEAIIKAAEDIPDGTIFEIGEVEVSVDDIVNYAEKTIEQLDAKAVKAKETAAKKKAEGDDLLAVVKDALTDEYRTGAEILADIAAGGWADVTQAKVTARLTKLVKAGEAHKTDVKTADGRKVKGYALGAAPAEDAE